MRFLSIQGISNLFQIAILFVLIFVAVFGLSHSMFSVDSSQMSNCPFMVSKMTICSMGVAEHISQWQSMFTFTAPQKALAFALLLLLAVVLVAVAILKRNLLLLFSHYITRWQLYIKHNPELSLFNPLKEAFSQGILNPKIF